MLHPGEFVLGSTLEVVTLPDDLAGRLEGKSSLGRLGLLTHSTAGFIDPGFSGHITLELSNVANLPITLWPGMKIGQLCLFRLSSAAEHPYGSAMYGSRYQGQRGPTPSRSYQNFRRWPTASSQSRRAPTRAAVPPRVGQGEVAAQRDLVVTGPVPRPAVQVRRGPEYRQVTAVARPPPRSPRCAPRRYRPRPVGVQRRQGHGERAEHGRAEVVGPGPGR